MTHRGVAGGEGTAEKSLCWPERLLWTGSGLVLYALERAQMRVLAESPAGWVSLHGGGWAEAYRSLGQY